ncbi:MAG: desulfoferrodoxin [Thermoplasmata archaeon]|nr:desulfoferrodoxin [Thermoplasmata archaeon]
MTGRKEIYKCTICGNIVEVLHEGAGQLVCCGQPMDLMEEKTADSSTEKHVPVIERTEKGWKVTVGSTLHPMTEEHYIEWIEFICCNGAERKYLKPGDPPEAKFTCDCENVSAREYCTIHGLWKS